MGPRVRVVGREGPCPGEVCVACAREDFGDGDEEGFGVGEGGEDYGFVIVVGGGGVIGIRGGGGWEGCREGIGLLLILFLMMMMMVVVVVELAVVGVHVISK